MRKQLSQPSFVNGFARSKGESARPDLWLDHMWYPMLGNQGAFLLSPANPPANLVSVVWGMGTRGAYLSCNGVSGYGTTNIYGRTRDITCMALIKTADTATSERYIIGANYNNYIMQFGLYNKKIRLGLRDGTTFVGLSANTVVTDNLLHLIAVTVSASGAVSFYLDGKPDGTGDASTVNQANTSVPLALCGRNSGSGTYNYLFFGEIYMMGYTQQQFPQSQILALTADPLLPLRRKKQWSMYVPSSGGVFKPFWCQTPTTIGAA